MNTPVKTNNRSYVSHFKKVLAANGVNTPVNVQGSVFVCTESTAQFQMSIDDGPFFPMELGLSIYLKEGDLFNSLNFKSDSGEAITIKFYVGGAELKDSRLNTLLERQIAVGYRALPTRILTNVATSLAADETVALPGENAGQRRKQILISNNDEDGDIQLLDADDNVFFTIIPKTGFTLETNATVKVHNDTVAAVAVNISEIYYDDE